MRVRRGKRARVSPFLEVLRIDVLNGMYDNSTSTYKIISEKQIWKYKLVWKERSPCAVAA